MYTGETQRAIGLFSDRTTAEAALTKLRDAGFNMDKISVVTDTDRANSAGSMAGTEVKSKDEQAAGGAKAGAIAGSATGGVMGLVGSLGVLAIPGVGPVLEVGVLLANGLLGAGLGAAGGSLIGALVGWGVPEEKANYYNSRVDAGEYLVLAEGTTQELQMAETILSENRVQSWYRYTPETR
ncbi:MAG: hypothetical protein HC816_20315 [Leptolyngbyaceae cyanobacterium RM1_1_2]|nr:hypothetical protein [Leptolyngbyaceae cyanobacterium RM1_1_2]